MTTATSHHETTRSPTQGTSAVSKREIPHLFQLDGWRGISILLVLACHMLPVGPHILKLNATAGLMGMSLFFTLSGFLITTFLLRRPDVKAFLIRRLCRILPLAWGYLVIVLIIFHASIQAWLANIFFTINEQTQYITGWNAHFWSLCTEMHFYLAVALVVALLGKRGLYVAIPVLCLTVTGWRIAHGARDAIATQFRVDEILAGAWLALLYWNIAAKRLPFGFVPPWVAIIALFVTSNPWCGPLLYLRPYAGAFLVATTLYQPEHWISRPLGCKPLKYLATISYALYVVHPITMYGWMNDGNRWLVYILKRPISFVAAFALAHLSTFYWEAYWIRLGKRLTSKPAPRPEPVAAS